MHVDDAGLFDQETLDASWPPASRTDRIRRVRTLLEDGLHGAGREDPAFLDHRDDVADLGELGQDVRAEEDGLAVGGELANQRAELDARARVEVRGRLVEDEQLRIVNDRPAERDALLETLGEAFDVAIARDRRCP